MRYRLTRGSRAHGKTSVLDAEKWCAEHRGEPSRRARVTGIEIAALRKRCGLEETMSFNDGVNPERVGAMEELVRDLLERRCRQSCADCEHEEDDGCEFGRRARELGIEARHG